MSAARDGWMTPVTDCLFCRIVTGQIPANLVAEGERVLAFRDLNPQAPTHVLVIPKLHVASLAAVQDGQWDHVAAVTSLAARVARELGLAESGYRCVFNSGRDAGQTVHHLHLHLLGGRPMLWPPG